MWKGVLVGIITTVVGGLILFGILGLISTHDQADIEVSYSEIRIPGPGAFADDMALYGVNEALKKSAVTLGLSDVLTKVGSRDSLSVIEVKIRNKGILRSKAIDIVITGTVFWFIDGHREETSKDRLQIEPIDPRSTKTILALSRYTFEPIPQVIENGRDLVVTSNMLDSYHDSFGISWFTRTYPGLITGIVFLVCGLLWLGGVPLLFYLISRAVSDNKRPSAAIGTASSSAPPPSNLETKAGGDSKSQST